METPVSGTMNPAMEGVGRGIVCVERTVVSLKTIAGCGAVGSPVFHNPLPVWMSALPTKSLAQMDKPVWTSPRRAAEVCPVEVARNICRGSVLGEAAPVSCHGLDPPVIAHTPSQL